MNSNMIAGLVIAAIVIIGGIFIIITPDTTPTSSTSTTSESSSESSEVPALPVATTTAASSIGTSTATLHGIVTPNGPATMYWFEYSSDPDIGAALKRTTDRMSVIDPQDSVAASITDLARYTTYFFRIVSQNSSGTVQGGIQSFTTK